MAAYDLWKLDKKLKKAVDLDRYHHTLGVMYTAASLAMRWDIDTERAMVAGLLHDCAKCIPTEKKLELCRKGKVDISDFELNHPFLIHAKLGAYLAGTKYDVKDKEILSAIKWHTTGRPAMTRLEKIIYIADYIEPARNKAPNLETVRVLAFTDLDRCMYQILKDSVSYLSQTPEDMDPMTSKAYDYYAELFESDLDLEDEGENKNE